LTVSFRVQARRDYILAGSWISFPAHEGSFSWLSLSLLVAETRVVGSKMIILPRPTGPQSGTVRTARDGGNGVWIQSCPAHIEAGRRREPGDLGLATSTAEQSAVTTSAAAALGAGGAAAGGNEGAEQAGGIRRARPLYPSWQRAKPSEKAKAARPPMDKSPKEESSPRIPRQRLFRAHRTKGRCTHAV